MKMKVINVSGVIIPNDYQDIYDWIGIEGTSPKKVSSNLLDGQDVLVNINSVGGDVWSGSEIYTMLKAHNGRVEVNITGLAASAASVIAMAGEVVRMSPPAQMMIHNASGNPSGNKHTIKSALQQLEMADEGLLNTYKLKTGLSDDEINEIMDATTWMSANTAKEKGFADEIMFAETTDLQITASFTGLLDKEKINELKSIMNLEKKLTAHENEAGFLLAKSQYDLLKLKKG